MLLIDPPLTIGEWTRTRFQTPQFERSFERYWRAYESAVLSLPPGEIARIVAWLVRDFEECEVGPQTFHRIVEREVEEGEFEPSGKVARLVVLESLAEALKEQEIRIFTKTDRLLTLSRELVPLILLLAIDDHFGVVQEPD